MKPASDLKASARAKRALAASVLILLCLSCARAQSLTPPKVEVKAAAGSSSFTLTDDSDLEHKIAGGSVRIYLTRRLSVEPEFVYMRHGKDDQDYHFIQNVAYDFDLTDRFVPYVVAGAGIEHHRGRYDGANFSGNTWTVSAGVGAKIFLTDRIFVAPELRFGHEPSMRTSVGVGFVLFGRKRVK